PPTSHLFPYTTLFRSAYDAKEAAFDDAPFGIVGLETAFAVAYTELVLGGALTLPELIARMSSAPAAAFRLPGGALTPGVPADIEIGRASCRESGCRAD